MKENEDSTYLLSKISEFKSCSCWASTVSFVCFVGQHVFRQFPTSSTIGSCFLGLCSVRVHVCLQAHTIEKQLASTCVREMCCVVEQGRTEKGIFSGLDIYRAFAGTQEKGLNSGLPFPSKCRPKRHKREIFGFSSLSLCLTGFFSKSLAWNLPHYYTRVSPEESRLMHIALVYMIPCILAFFKIVC